MNQTIKEKIKQRRRQMLVHSYLYYEKDVNIISDATWSEWAVELAELQKKYPKESKETEFFNMFSTWDGSTGAFLRYTPEIISVAEHLYANYKKHEFDGNKAFKTVSHKKSNIINKKRAKSLF